MSTGIGNEWDPGDPPEIHNEPAQPADFERGRLQGREEILSIIDGTFGSKQLAEKIRKLELAAQPAGEFDDKKS
jgi:hypothetical protein